MNNNIKRTSVLLLAFIAVSTVLVVIFREKVMAYFIPTVRPVGEIHIKVDNDTSYINSQLTIQNRSFLKIGIDTIRYKIMLFDKVYLKSVDHLGIDLSGEETDTIDFSIKIPYKEIIEDMAVEGKLEDSASYSIDVSLQYSTFLGRSEMPFSKTSKLKIPQPPEFKIIEMEYKKVRRRSVIMEAKIQITNHNEIALIIKEMNYSLDVLNQGSIKGSLKERINVKALGTTFVHLPITIASDNVAVTIFNVLMNTDRYDYTLNVKARLESIDPIQSFSIDLTKSGEMELRK